MKTTIYKYDLKIVGQNLLSAPAGAIPLSVQAQLGKVVMWMQVDLDKKEQGRSFRFYGTGHAMPEYPGKYVGTVQLFDDGTVWHLYDQSGGT